MEEEQIRPQQTKDDLRARVNIQNKLIEQQQKHIDALTTINQMQEQQLALFTKKGKVWQNRFGKIGNSTALPLFTPRRTSLRFLPRPFTVILILLVLSLLGNGLGIYGATTGRLPWQRNKPYGSPTSISLGKTVLVSTPTPPALSTEPYQVTIPGLFTISGYALSPFFVSVDGFCTGFALATDQLTYTRDELHGIYNFFKYNMYKVPPPKLLKRVDGGSTANSTSLLLPQIEDCPTGWEMTNIGQKPIQLVQFRMKLLINSTEADPQYRLVDYCSVLAAFESLSGNCPGLGGQGQPISYTFSFGSGKAGSFIQGQSTVGVPTINTKSTLFLDFKFLPAISSAALLYTIEPEFVITTSKEKDEVIDLPQWKETFVMAPASHFGCYQLQGSTFVSVDKGSICF